MKRTAQLGGCEPWWPRSNNSAAAATAGDAAAQLVPGRLRRNARALPRCFLAFLCQAGEGSHAAMAPGWGACDVVPKGTDAWAYGSAGEKSTNAYIYIYIYIHTHTYIHIHAFMYMCI